MNIKKTSSNIRDDFKHIATDVYNQKQEEAGFPVARMTVSLRADMELVAHVDELAERLNTTRQAVILQILENGVYDAIGGYIDIFGEHAGHELWEGANQRFADFRNKQMDKFNKNEGDDA